MMDFKILQARTLLTVRSVSPIRGFLPPSVVVLGERMDLASQVFFNEVQVTEFIIQTSSRLIVRIPPSQIGQEFKSLRVYSSTNLAGQNALLQFAVQTPLSNISGIDRLVQAWMMIFMTNPGSDIFDPTSGGGARAIIGRPTDRQGKGVAADLAVAIDKTRSELLTKQAKNPNIPLAERLLNSTLTAISFDSTTTSLIGQVAITNVLGDTGQVSVGN